MKTSILPVVLNLHSDWYSLEKSKRVKPFRCGEFDECIENAKVQAHVQNMSQNEGKCACREYAIMHALEIEKSRFPPEGNNLEADILRYQV